MIGKTHALIGASIVMASNEIYPFIQAHSIQGVSVGPLLCAGAAVVGALLPDLDAEESTIKRELGLVGRVGSGILRLIGVKHRGATHWGIVGLGILILSILLGLKTGYVDVGLAFGSGYLSHLLADALTIQGVALLWPYPKNSHLLPGILRIRTGSPIETLLFTILAISFIIFLLPDIIPPEAWQLGDLR